MTIVGASRVWPTTTMHGRNNIGISACSSWIIIFTCCGISVLLMSRQPFFVVTLAAHAHLDTVVAPQRSAVPPMWHSPHELSCCRLNTEGRHVSIAFLICGRQLCLLPKGSRASPNEHTTDAKDISKCHSERDFTSVHPLCWFVSHFHHMC